MTTATDGLEAAPSRRADEGHFDRISVDEFRQRAHSARTGGDADGEAEAWIRLLQIADDSEAHARLSDLLPLLAPGSQAVAHIHALAQGDPGTVRAWVKARSEDLMTRLTAKSFPGTKYHSVPAIYGRAASKLVDMRNDALFYRLAEEARVGGRTLLYFDRLFTLYQAVVNLARRLPHGDTARMLEIGVYKGGTSHFMASVAQSLLGDRVEHIGVDTFVGHAAADLPTGAEGAHLPHMFSEAPFADVSAYLSGFPFVRLLEGRIQDVWSQLGDKPFHFIHLDVDIYEPTLFALSRCDEVLAPGGTILVDDYGFVTCPGVRTTVDDYIAANPRRFARFELLTGQCLLVS